jgi:hypothetical protein
MVLVTIEFEKLKEHCEWLNTGNYCGLTHKTCNQQECPLVEKVNEKVEV